MRTVIVKRKPVTPVLCPKCGSHNVVCAVRDRKIDGICTSCMKPFVIEHKMAIKPVKQMPLNTAWLNVFHGPWNKDEVELVEEMCRSLGRQIPFIQDDWRYFKGLNLYTAWRNTWNRNGKVLAEPTLDDLVDEVEEQCHQLHRQ